MDGTQLLRALDASPAAQVITRHRKVAWCNQAFAQLFGYPAQELVGRSLAALYPSDKDFADIGRRGLERMRRDPNYQDERMMRRRDGTVFWCRARGVSLTPQAPFAMAVWTFEEISDPVRQAAGLSARERQIVALIGEGRTSKEIGRHLDLSHRTVEAHRLRAMRKLGVRNVAELMAQILLSR